ncbi:hypothetical protein [Methanimicrococcus hongohii]|nr:hypothetical protein [Methanimicrococcus sp. Hf6]
MQEDLIHPKIVQTQIIDGELYVTFTDERYPNLAGIVQFQRGWNLLWHPVKADFGDWPISVMNTNFNEDMHSEIVYGIQTDSRIAYYESIVTLNENEPEETVLYGENITAPNFIHKYETEYYTFKFHLYDVEGNNITADFFNGTYNDSIPRGTVSSGGLGNYRSMYTVILLAGLIIAWFFWANDPRPISWQEKKETKREKKTFSKIKKEITENPAKKKAAMVFAAVLIFSVLLYTAFYSTLPTSNSLERSIERSTDAVNVTVLETKKDNGDLLVLFKSDNKSGLVTFKQGLNFLYQPYAYSTNGDNYITAHYQIADIYNRVIVTGVDCDPEAASYKVIQNYYDTEKEQIIHYQNKIHEPDFIDIYEPYKPAGYWGVIRIYDADGNDITKDYSNDGGGGWLNYSSLYLKTKLCQVIFVLGLLLAWGYWITPDRKKEDED